MGAVGDTHVCGLWKPCAEGETEQGLMVTVKMFT